MDREVSKLTRAQAAACEHEGERVGTHDPVWLSFNIGVIKAKRAKLANVLRGL